MSTLPTLMCGYSQVVSSCSCATLSAAAFLKDAERALRGFDFKTKGIVEDLLSQDFPKVLFSEEQKALLHKVEIGAGILVCGLARLTPFTEMVHDSEIILTTAILAIDHARAKLNYAIARTLQSQLLSIQGTLQEDLVRDMTNCLTPNLVKRPELLVQRKNGAEGFVNWDKLAVALAGLSIITYSEVTNIGLQKADQILYLVYSFLKESPFAEYFVDECKIRAEHLLLLIAHAIEALDLSLLLGLDDIVVPTRQSLFNEATQELITQEYSEFHKNCIVAYFIF